MGSCMLTSAVMSYPAVLILRSSSFIALFQLCQGPRQDAYTISSSEHTLQLRPSKTSLDQAKPHLAESNEVLP